jgi:hypothetical protein
MWLDGNENEKGRECMCMYGDDTREWMRVNVDG